MTAIEILAELYTRQITIKSEGDRLVVDAPKGSLTPNLYREIREHKPELLALLPYVSFSPPDRTKWIRDPRPELEDTELWGRLLTIAFDEDGNDPVGLFGSLHGLRCGGARLVRDGGRLYLIGGDWGDEYPDLYIKWIVFRIDKLNEMLEKVF